MPRRDSQAKAADIAAFLFTFVQRIPHHHIGKGLACFQRWHCNHVVIDKAERAVLFHRERMCAPGVPLAHETDLASHILAFVMASVSPAPTSTSSAVTPSGGVAPDQELIQVGASANVTIPRVFRFYDFEHGITRFPGGRNDIISNAGLLSNGASRLST